MASIRSVADAAQVSIATVSRVLNNHPTVAQDLRSRVLEAANRLGYTPSRGRVTEQVRIALAYSGPVSIDSPYDAALLRGITEGLAESDFDVVVLDLKRSRDSSESFTQMFLRKGVRAVVLRTTTRSRSVCRQIAAERFPCVVVGDRFEADEPVGWVHGDSRRTSYQAVAHLAGLGHRRVAVAAGLVDDTDHADRLAGYHDAVRELGLSDDPALVMRVPAFRDGGVQVARTVLTMSDPPTAVFALDPGIATGLINQCHELGLRVPGDLSVVGIDDGDTRFSVFPQMTAVCQDTHAIGHEAVAALARQLADPDTPPIRRELETWLEIHRTTGPVGAAAHDPDAAGEGRGWTLRSTRGGMTAQPS